MIYNEYKVVFFRDDNSKAPVLEYIDRLPKKEKAKVLKYIDFLREKRGVLYEPYSKHVVGKIRELRVDIGRNRHRIFYFTFIGKKIILLHAFMKKTAKTPLAEKNRALNNYKIVVKNPKQYE